MGSKYRSIFLSLILLLLPLAGCVSQGDYDSEISEKQSQIDNLTDDSAVREQTITNLQSQLNNVTVQRDNSQAELASIQSELTSAQNNITYLQGQTESLELELTLAQEQVESLSDMLENSTNSSNETIGQMAEEIATLKLQISNLSTELSESNARYQENVSKVAELSSEILQLNAEILSLSTSIESKNQTILLYLNSLQSAQSALSNASLYIPGNTNDSAEWGLLESYAILNHLNGAPSLNISYSNGQTFFNYTSSIQDAHLVMFEFCNVSSLIPSMATDPIDDWQNYEILMDWITNVALNLNYSLEENSAFRIDFGTFVSGINCIVIPASIASNTFNQTWVFSNLGILSSASKIGQWVTSSAPSMTVQANVCKSDCMLDYLMDYDGEPQNDYFEPMGYQMTGRPAQVVHPLHGQIFIPVKITSAMPCMFSWNGDQTTCQLPQDCTEISDWETPFVDYCHSVIIWEIGAYKTTNATLYNATSAIIYQGGAYSDQDVYICEVDADIMLLQDVYGDLNVYVRYLGANNAVNLSYASGARDGSVSGDLGSKISYIIGTYSDIRIYHWSDPNGIC